MADIETKYKHSTNYRRNLIAKTLKDAGERKGAFAMKVIDSRKQQYKRQKMRVTEMNEYEDE